MRMLLKSLLLVVLCSSIGFADEPLKVWSYEELNDIRFSASKGNDASMSVSPDIKTPEGKAVLKVELKEFKPDAVPWDIQLRFIHSGGLKAGRSYEISFLCKSSVSGLLKMNVAQAKTPWESLPGGGMDFEVGLEWKKVQLSFTAQKDHAEELEVPRFMLAKFGSPATLYFGPLSLVEKDVK